MSSIAGQAQPPTFSGQVQMPQQSGSLPYTQGTYTIIAPNGQQIQVSAEEFAGTMGGAPPPQSQAPGGQLAGAAGEMAGQYASSQVGGALTGGSELGGGALNWGGIQGPASPVSSPGGFDMGYGPSQYMTEGGGGMQLPNQMGVNGPTYSPDQIAQGMQAAPNPMLGQAGMVAGAYVGGQQLGGVVNAVKGKDLTWQQQAALFPLTGGASLLYNPVKKMLDKDEWKRERNNLNRLKENGVFIPDNLLAGMPTKGRKLEDLIRKDLPADFVGTDPNTGEWVNNKFAKSRNVADLQPTDIVNYSAFAENDPNWFNKPMEERMSFAQQALAANAVTEGKGTIKVDFQKLNAPAQPTPQTAPKAPAATTDIKVQPKDPNVAKPPVNTSTVQKPVAPKAGALSLNPSGGGGLSLRGGTPQNSGQPRRTLFGGR